MKKPFNSILLSAIVLMSAVSLQTVNAQNTFPYPSTGSIGIGASTADASALLEVKSTTKGVLFPRMTTTQRGAIASPATGLLVYVTNGNSKGFSYYNGSAWKPLNNVNGLNSDIFIGLNAGNATNIALGTGNIGIGKAAYALNVDRIENIAIGDSSQYTLGVGSIGNQAWYNVAVGSKSQRYSTTGTKNTSVGAYSLYNTIAGNDDVAIGYKALYSNVYNHFCVAVGEEALTASKSDNNTACGYMAGSLHISGEACSFFGANADQTNSNSYTNSTALGANSTITGDAVVRIGSSPISSIGGFANWSNVSDGRYKKAVTENVPGLEFINKLKPVTYHLDVTGLRKFLNEDRGSQNLSPEGKANIERLVKEKEQVIYSGFIAQDVERAAQETGYDFSGVDKPQNNESLYGLRYAEFTVPLVKAVQELDKLNQELKTKNEMLESRVTALENMINQQNSASKTSNLQLPTSSFLLQNQPNPFNKATIIRYQLSGDSKSGQIIIRDLNGNLVKQVSISQSGKGQATINANELAQGTYTYTLEIAGESVDTKLMVVTK